VVYDGRQKLPNFWPQLLSTVSGNSFWRFFLIAENYSVIFLVVYLAAKNIIDLVSAGFF
jgi:hypothetical protein